MPMAMKSTKGMFISDQLAVRLRESASARTNYQAEVLTVSVSGSYIDRSALDDVNWVFRVSNDNSFCFSSSLTASDLECRWEESLRQERQLKERADRPHERGHFVE